MDPRTISLLLFALLLAGCETNSPAPETGPPVDTAETPEPAPTPSEAEIWLRAADATEAQYQSGMELGTPEPREEIASRYEDGLTLFAYAVPRLGSESGRELLLIVVNVRSQQRIDLPSGRGQVAYLGSDGESQRFAAEAGYIQIDTASDEGLWGSFEVRFDELDQVVVHGQFDTRAAPASGSPADPTRD